VSAILKRAVVAARLTSGKSAKIGSLHMGSSHTFAIVASTIVALLAIKYFGSKLRKLK
jgi:hypothetical protein